jgi:hypothetical protein
MTYGEVSNVYIRQQAEIVKRNADETILGRRLNASIQGPICLFLAPSPGLLRNSDAVLKGGTREGNLYTLDDGIHAAVKRLIL